MVTKYRWKVISVATCILFSGFPHNSYSADGLVSRLVDLEEKTASLEQENEDLLVMINALLPQGAIVAFNSTRCPSSGWKPYFQGVGRYVVGMHSNGELALTVGEKLKDGENRATGIHKHMHTNSFVGGNGDTTVKGGRSYPRKNLQTQTLSTIPEGGTTISNGTNAPYVQLLFCERSD